MRLGDAVATVFQPIAVGIDSVFGTDIQNCSGCKGRQAALNQLSDELFALLSRRARDNDTSPMDYTVSKTVTIHVLITNASGPEDAIERAQKGEGQKSAGAQNWVANVVKPQQQQQPRPEVGPAAALGIPHGR